MTPEMEVFIKQAEQYQKTLQNEIDESRKRIEEKESRLLLDIARETLSHYQDNEAFVRYAWKKIRKQYPAGLSKRAGRWGHFDLVGFIGMVGETYVWTQITDTIFESMDDFPVETKKSRLGIVKKLEKKLKEPEVEKDDDSTTT